MHWLTWKQVAEFLRTWQGAAAAAIGLLAAIYYGPKKMLETYDWYMDRFWDYPIRDFLRSQVIPQRLTAYGETSAKPVAKTITEISIAVGRPEKRILGSLKRLRRRHQVSPDGDKWKAVL